MKILKTILQNTLKNRIPQKKILIKKPGSKRPQTLP